MLPCGDVSLPASWKSCK
uniref:Uncharacterized protein n=1 Tax=Anguilla anguilla TaxID=7936 RepID=A0A0E9W1N4_ANGAN